jgi:hypothetical protein
MTDAAQNPAHCWQENVRVAPETLPTVGRKTGFELT